MSRKVTEGWFRLQPEFAPRSAAQRVFREHAVALEALLSCPHTEDQLAELLRRSLSAQVKREETQRLRAALLVLTDLARQRWEIRARGARSVEVRRSGTQGLELRAEKARVRAQEQVKRDEQLRKPATKRFIERVEQGSMDACRCKSIYCLMRHGPDLADQLRAARALRAEARAEALKGVIDPYIQFVDGTTRCEVTGLRLQDIWRYFRHTWSNQYTNTPGRTMAFLVRDRAAPRHAVMGIGAIGSPIVQIRERDDWIGWQPEVFLERAAAAPTSALWRWLWQILERAIDEIYVQDLLERGLISHAELEEPSDEVLARLKDYSRRERNRHHQWGEAKGLKKGRPQEEAAATHWEARARSHLYRSKRALALAELLRSRQVLSQFSDGSRAERLGGLLSCVEGRAVVKRLLRKAKADRVGIAMADITVCGAIDPYRSILGGKLVSMLAASPEVVAEYRRRYAARESEIASSMAGRPIVRPSKLVFLGTTSLYGVGSSQYNRLRLPAERLGGRAGEQLRFQELGRSEAYGTSQFSAETVSSLVAVVEELGKGRVNSLFGEGVSPKLRKVRDGLTRTGFPADQLLQHGRHRIVYGVPLIRNLRDFLIGLDHTPDYLYSLEDPEAATAEIGAWWRERWLARRIESDAVLDELQDHDSQLRPIVHGAKVKRPEDEDQPWLAAGWRERESGG